MQCEICGEELVQMYAAFTVDCPKCREEGNLDFPERLTLPQECLRFEKEMAENWVAEATQGTEFPPKIEVKRGEIGTSEWFTWLWSIEECY